MRVLVLALSIAVMTVPFARDPIRTHDQLIGAPAATYGTMPGAGTVSVRDVVAKRSTLLLAMLAPERSFVRELHQPGGQRADQLSSATALATDVATYVARDAIGFAGWAGLAQIDPILPDARPMQLDIAVGPEHVVQSSDYRIRITNRAGENEVTLGSWELFPQARSVPTSLRFVYDSVHARWLAAGSGIECAADAFPRGWLYLAASDTPDPTGSWHRWALTDLGGGTSRVPTDVRIGTSTELVALSFDTRPITPGCEPGFAGDPDVRIFDWSSIQAAPTSLPSWGPTLSWPLDWTLWQPAVQMPATSPLLYFLGLLAATSDITYRAVGGSVAAQTLAFAPPVNLAEVGVPSRTATGIPPHQPGGALDLGPSSTYSDVVWQDGRLAFALETSCTPTGDSAERACVRLIELETTGATPARIRDVALGESGRDSFIGGVAFSGDRALHVVWNSSSSDPNGFVSSKAARILPGDAANEVGATETVTAGEANYDKIGWDVDQPIAPDPAVPAAVWQGAPYAAANGLWATTVSRLEAPQSDTTGPTAPGTPSTTLRTGASISGNAIPVTVSWTASTDSGSGLQARPYGLESSTDGGSTWHLAGVFSSHTVAITLGSGVSTRFRVVAWDAAGNRTAGPAASARTAVLVQQSASGVTYRGTWSSTKSSSFSGGSVKFAKQSGASATFRFAAREVSLVTTLAASRGRAKVYLDGIFRTKLNLDRVPSAYRVLTGKWTWSASRQRSLRLVNLATSGRPRIDVDAFVILR